MLLPACVSMMVAGGGGIETRGWGSKGRNVTWALKATLCHGIIIILRLTAWYSGFIPLTVPTQGRSAKSVAKKFRRMISRVKII